MNELRMIPLLKMKLDPANARHSRDDPGLPLLAASLAEQGQISPIVVRRDADGKTFLVSIGGRRFRAAQLLDWPEMAALVYEGDPADIEAMSATENMVRVAMHPVDEWLAVKHQVDNHGWSIERVARALGVDSIRIPRMKLLAEMAPAVLEAMRLSMPSEIHIVRTIARADHATQEAAIGRYDPKLPLENHEWRNVSEACVTRRIKRELAIFDHSLIAWDEDLFAEPTDENRFSTDNIDDFMLHQTAALDAEMAKLPDRYLPLAKLDGYQVLYEAIPRGWTQSWDKIPKRWKKDDPRKVLKGLHVGGSRIGYVETILVDPKPEKASVKGDDGASETAARPTIAKSTLRLLAEKKRDAVLDRVTLYRKDADLVRILLLAICADNVIWGDRAYNGRGTTATTRLKRALINADGRPHNLSLQEMRPLIHEALYGMLVFRAPEVFSSSGAAAEWLARAVKAEMPRCDTPDILAGVSMAELKRLAEESGVDAKGTAKQLKERLAGKLPDWRPDDFRDVIAPVPSDDDADENQEAAE